MNSILIHEAAVKPLGHLRKRKTNGDSYEFIQIKTPLSVKLLRPGPCPFRRSPADCVMDTATSSCCCTSHRPHLEKICKQAGGSRSLTHADGPLWAALLNVQERRWRSHSSFCPSTKLRVTVGLTDTRDSDRDVNDKLDVTQSKCL